MRNADTIIKSKTIFNGTAAKLIDGIVAIKDDQIQYVGSDEVLNQLQGPKTEIIDVGEKPVMPGFHDAHIHMYMSGLYASPFMHVSFTDTSAIECIEGLSELSQRIAKDQWLIGAGWYYTLWDEPVLPTKEDIDAYYPDRPVCMVSADCHTLWVNSVGLEKLGLNKDSVPPSGGSYAKDDKGKLNGIIQESAATSLITKVYNFDNDTVKSFYIDFMKELNSFGITSVCDVSMMSVPGADFIREDIYQELLDEDGMTVRVNMYPTLMKDLSRPYELQDQFSGDIVSCQGVKQFFDGVSSTHTAYLKEDYTSAKFEGDRGYPTMPEEDMEALVLSAHKNDFSVRVHTIGDQAIHRMIDFYEKAREVYGDKPYLQHTLEHLENLQVEDIKRLADNNILPSVQPPHLMIDPNGVEIDLGQERIQYMWPFRMMLDAGCELGFGTDSPVVVINPFHGLYNAVTRRSVYTKEPAKGWIPKEKISLFEALRAYTYGAACAANRKDKVGALTAGKWADVIVLDKNIFKEDVDELLNTNVEMTFMAGKLIYKK